ncbi:MAG: hypothetical protein IJJ15_06995 [Ruminococcus sp.]|nr:hypothetical protein [Ruminococcus sp.]
MKKLKLLISLMLIAAVITAGSIAVSGAEVDIAESEVNLDAAIIAADYEEVGTVMEPDRDLPSSYSSKDQGYVTQARSQQYNTCWAFSSSSAMESLLLMHGEEITHLSVAHMNYWATPDKNGKGWQRTYSGGGYPYIPLGYYSSWSGGFTEEAFPITTSFSDFDRDVTPEKPQYSATSIVYLNGNDKDTVKTAVYNYGSAVASFHYSATYMKNFNYYCYVPGLKTSQLNGHSIAIVGWDDDYDKQNFYTETIHANPNGDGTTITETHVPERNGAWLCKSSWGPSFGYDGCFWLSYEDMYMFDSRFGPVFAIADYQEIDDSVKLYQNEIYGADRSFDYPTQIKPQLESMTFANVFDFSDYMTVLDKVIFETKAIGSEYTLYYIPVNAEFEPILDREKWIELGSGIVDYQGYVCIDVEDREILDGRGAVAVQLKKTERADNISIGTGEWIRRSSTGQYVFSPDTSDGQSFIIGFDDTALDVMDFYRVQLNDEIGGTLVLKAVAKESDIHYGDPDMDGKITILDATAIQKNLAVLISFDELQKLRADYDLDGKITVLDATRVQKRLASLV